MQGGGDPEIEEGGWWGINTYRVGVGAVHIACSCHVHITHSVLGESRGMLNFVKFKPYERALRQWRFTYRFTQNEEPRLPPISVHNTLHSTFCGIGYPDLDIWRMHVSQIIHCLKL